MKKLDFDVKRIWVIGYAFHASKYAREEARFELLLHLAFSTMPLWLTCFVMVLFGVADSVELWTAMEKALLDIIGHGELFMLSTAMLGSSAYVFIRNNETIRESIPSGRNHLLTSIFIGLLATAIFFGLKFSDDELSRSWLMITFSAVVYFISALVLYPPMAIHHDKIPKDPRKVSQGETKSFMEGYNPPGGA